ncbi:ADP-ribose pyrophosphatase [Spartobacteria bacterium LR76]|nr:ADP-ribose pyrophosphatase [Spartobacteria bacterium LR76]
MPAPHSLLEVSRELAAISQAGLAFSKDPFDRERFNRLREIAGEIMTAEIGRSGFRWPVESGYPTPKVDVRGAAFRGDSVLLVKESSSGLWTTPGGWADVNLSPAQNVEKEVLEESGYQVKAVAITSIIDRELAGFPVHTHSIYKIFFLCQIIGGEARTSIESTEIGFFRVDALPPLDRDRVSTEEIRRAHAFHKNAARPCYFN